MKYENLFKPIKIGPIEIKNRVGMAPMNVFFCEPDGSVSEQQMAYYAARAKGGVGLIVTEAVRINMEGVESTFYANLRLFDVNWQNKMSELFETIHCFGAKVFIQSNGGSGPQGSSARGSQPYAASAIAYEIEKENLPKVTISRLDKGQLYFHYKGEIPRPMTIEEIRKHTEDWAKSCKMAVVAGADGVQIHAAHGYLLHSFLSPRFNKRTDMYGGSLKNRMRFLLEVVEKVRDAIGPKVALGVRATADEHMPDGLTPDEMKVVVAELEKVGCDFFHVSSGSYENWKYMSPEKDGMWAEESKALKEAVKEMPILSGACHEPEAADRMIGEGTCDMILHGRPLLADPEWANKVKDGREGEIVKCIRDLECSARLQQGLPSRCPQNPNLGRERYMPEYWRPAVKKGYRRAID
jgi:2,4-dienoyl-CoA reductase-like NADH-dependent reductase (Old Yellow Enzyme family)